MKFFLSVKNECSDFCEMKLEFLTPVKDTKPSQVNEIAPRGYFHALASFCSTRSLLSGVCDAFKTRDPERTWDPELISASERTSDPMRSKKNSSLDDVTRWTPGVGSTFICVNSLVPKQKTRETLRPRTHRPLRKKNPSVLGFA